jgi:hypothetical protein
MTTPPIEAVVAGTRGFALALLAPMTERVGTRPHVAADAAHALVFGRGPGALVVVEFLGEDSLSAIKDLVLEGEGVRIVAALPDAHAAAEAPLRALGVEPVRWDGRPDGLLAAVARQMAAAAAAAAQAAARAAAPPSRRAAATAARTARSPAPPGPSGRTPPARPAAPAAPPRLVTPGAPAPARPAAPVAPPAAPAAGGSFEGIDDEIAAITDALGAEAPPPPSAGGLFDDLEGEADHDFDVDVEQGLLAPAPEGSGGPWPADVPGPVEAADALGRALAGGAPAGGGALAVVPGVIASLTDLERAILSGEPSPVDAEPVRRAAVMRVRVAAALATAPAPGGAVDAGAVSAFLVEIDGLLSDVSALAAGAPPEVQASIEAVRNALVKEAIDFSEAAQRASPAGALAPAAPAAPRARTGETRVLSMTAAPEEVASPRRQRALVAGLVVAALATAAFHGYRYWAGSVRVRQAPTLPGAPAGAIATPGDVPNVPNAPKVLHSAGGEAFDRSELKAFAAQEARKGNTVHEIAPGAIMVVPGEGAPAPGGRSP